MLRTLRDDRRRERGLRLVLDRSEAVRQRDLYRLKLEARREVLREKGYARVAGEDLESP